MSPAPPLVVHPVWPPMLRGGGEVSAEAAEAAAKTTPNATVTAMMNRVILLLMSGPPLIFDRHCAWSWACGTGCAAVTSSCRGCAGTPTRRRTCSPRSSGRRVKGDFCQLAGKPARAADVLAQGKEELHAALAELERTLAGALPDDTGAVRLDEDDKLVIPS